jgi:hypothetical protein
MSFVKSIGSSPSEAGHNGKNFSTWSMCVIQRTMVCGIDGGRLDHFRQVWGTCCKMSSHYNAHRSKTVTTGTPNCNRHTAKSKLKSAAQAGGRLHIRHNQKHPNRYPQLSQPYCSHVHWQMEIGGVAIIVHAPHKKSTSSSHTGYTLVSLNWSRHKWLSAKCGNYRLSYSNHIL